MNSEREIHFGREAVEYIRECLADGNTFAQLLLAGMDLDAGQTITVLPQEVGDESAREFRTGGKLPVPPHAQKVFAGPDGSQWRMEPKPSMELHLVTTIREFLGAESERIVMFENHSASPGDPFLARSGTQILVHQDEVYHFLISDDHEPAKIVQTVRVAESPHLFICAMTSVSNRDSWPSQTGKVTREELENLVKRTERIVIGAYDGEGYLFWSRRS